MIDLLLLSLLSGFVQKSRGNGPLNRLLMAAKRKYMETELPPQESEGKTAQIPQYLTSDQMCGEPWDTIQPP